MSNGNSSNNESSPAESRVETIQRAARRERLLKIGLAVISVGLVALISLFVYNYIQARTGPPKSSYEFQLNTLKLWQDAVKKDPKDSAAHTNLGFAYLQMGKEGLAISEFTKAIKYDSKNADAYLYLGRLYLKIDQADKAIPNFKKASKYAPERGRALAYYSLGEIYEEKKDYERAFDFYTKSAEDEPLMWNVHYKLGQLYERDGKKDLALQEYQKAGEFNPGNKRIQEAIERVSK